MNTHLRVLFALIVTLSLQTLAGHGQGTAFTYQGRLNSGGVPAQGIYDLRFAMYDSPGGGTLIGGPVTNVAVAVTNGLFTTTIDFGNVFSGANYWLDLGVRSNGVVIFSALAPRQPVTPAPYAIMANTASNLLGNLPAAQLSGTIPSGAFGGTYGNAVNFNNGGNSFSGDGSGLANLNASQLTSGTIPNARLATNVAFVNSNQVFTGNNAFLRPVGIGTANPVFPLDVVAGQSVGRFISTNAIYGSVVELINKATNGAFYLGAINFNNAQSAFPGQIGYVVYDPTNPRLDVMEFRIAGNEGLRLRGDTRGYGYGAANLVGGDPNNSISSVNAGGNTIAGGGGSVANTVLADSGDVFIGAGSANLAGPGVNNVVIGGGYGNVVRASQAVIGGGYYNAIGSSNESSVVVGGTYDTIQSYAPYSFIGGGYYNTINGDYSAYTNYPLVASTISGGYYNTIMGTSPMAAIGGGGFNTIDTNAPYAFIGAGSGNEVGGPYSAILGGYANMAMGNSSFAFGTYARALHDGAVVISDGNYAYFSSTTPNQLSARFYGGVRFETSGGGMTLDGQQVLAGTVGSSQLTGTYSSQLDFNNPSDTFTGTFTGSGSGLTGLNASELLTGFVPSGRLAGIYTNGVTFNNAGNFMVGAFSGNGNLLTNLSASQLVGFAPAGVLSGNYSNAMTFNNSGNSFRGLFTGNGSGLTNLNAGQLATGTVADGRLAGTYSTAVTFNNSGNSFNGLFTGNGAGLTNLNAGQLVSGTVPSGVISGLYTNAVILNNGGNIFSGNGNGLTNLNAAQLATGVIPDARLGGNYSSAVVFNNSGNSFSGSFAGNGSGLTNLNASQLASGTVPDARLSGTYSGALTFNNSVNSFSGNGAGLGSLNASQLASGTVPAGVISGNYTNTVTLTNTGNSFAGNGGGLTNLNANQLTIGVVPPGRLAGQYTNQIIMTNAIDQFGGNGSMLTGVMQTVSVRGQVTSVINANSGMIFAGAPASPVSLEAGQKVFITVSAVLGTTNSSMIFDFSPAYTFNGGVTNFTDGINYLSPTLTSTSGHPIFSTSQVFLVPSTGSYVFGVGVRTFVGGILNGNDYYSVAAMAFR